MLAGFAGSSGFAGALLAGSAVCALGAAFAGSGGFCVVAGGAGLANFFGSIFPINF